MSQQRPPMIPPMTGPDASASLSPSDHVRMLVELLRPATPELARRWLAALLLVPESERTEVVAAVERQIIATYEHAPRVGANTHELDLVHPAVAHGDYVEQVVVTYAAMPASATDASVSSKKSGKRAAQRRSQTRA